MSAAEKLTQTKCDCCPGIVGQGRGKRSVGAVDRRRVVQLACLAESSMRPLSDHGAGFSMYCGKTRRGIPEAGETYLLGSGNEERNMIRTPKCACGAIPKSSRIEHSQKQKDENHNNARPHRKSNEAVERLRVRRYIH